MKPEVLEDPSRRHGQAEGLSVVLPAFNQEEAIGGTVAALREELRPLASGLEFIVVDDGSSDGTPAAAARLCRESGDVRLLRQPRNLGKGMAIYVGLLASRHATVCFTDADLAFSAGSYARVVERARGRPFVTASRRLPDSDILVRMHVLGYAARRHFVGVTFNALVRAFLGMPYRDTQCGLKVFDRRVGIDLFRRVRSPRFLFDIELFLAARAAGIPVEEVPVCVAYHDFKSSVKLTAESARMFLGLLGIWRRELRGVYRFPNPEMDPGAATVLATERSGSE